MVSSYILPASIFIGFAISSVWLIFFLLEDRSKPEPRYMITKTFSLGMAAALVAAIIEKTFMTFGDHLGWSALSFPIISGNALIEELIKFLAVFIFISATKYFDEPIDRMIYMIVSALGFAAAENFFFLSSMTSTKEFFSIAILRFIGATLMHSLASGILGYAWARKFAVLGLIAATIIHIIFNYIIIGFGAMIYPTVYLVGVAFILFSEFDRIKSYYYERKRT